MGQSPSSIFEMSCNGIGYTKKDLERQSVSQIIEHIRLLRSKDLDPTNRGWNATYYSHSCRIVQIIDRALLEQKYDFIKEFSTDPLIEDIIDVRRSLILKGKEITSYVGTCFMYTIFYIDQKGNVQERDPSDVQKALEALSSCKVLFDTMIKAIAYPKMDNVWWAMRGLIQPKYFSILRELMTGPFATLETEHALQDFFREILIKRAKATLDEIGLYNNFLDSVLENDICNQVFLNVLNIHSQRSFCDWCKSVKIDIVKDYWFRRVIEARAENNELEEHHHLFQLVEKQRKGWERERCEMYKIHAD